MQKYKVLSPLKQRLFNKEVYGFDCETYDNNKKIVCISIVGRKEKSLFFNKKDFIEYIKKKRFYNSYISATNLGFDFNAIFYNTEEIKHFDLLFRGSELITASSYICNGKFNNSREAKELKKQGKTPKKIVFIDTMNYAKLSVQQIGKILGDKKLKKPECLGKYPKNKKEWSEIIAYNFKDSELSYKFINFIYDTINRLGGSPQKTIASSSMNLFRTRFLKSKFFVHDTDILLEIFKSYCGGRCEIFKRGTIKNYKYFDVNSLYPSVMVNEYPDPNSLRITRKGDLSYITDFQGFSDITVSIEGLEYPLLPYRTETKLLFPLGTFRGYYSHIEIRKALELGYKIEKIHKTIYFNKICHPFKDYVEYLYNLRKQYKKEKNPMEKVVKLLLNSLYGKFGQKFINRDNWLPCNLSLKEIQKYDFIERVGNYFRVKTNISEPSVFCFPEWASYTTSYARLKLYDKLIKSDPIYCDTDSIITRKDLGDNLKLGELKLEYNIKKGVFVKPKFYGFLTDKYEFVKIKGLGKRITYNEFIYLLSDPKYTYKKFMKFKESVRRGFTPNEIVDIEKHFSLEDNKRIWDSEFKADTLQDSVPVSIT